MRHVFIILTLILGALSTLTAGQSAAAVDPKLQGQLKHLFPAATFSPKIPDPPHYKAFAPTAAEGDRRCWG